MNKKFNNGFFLIEVVIATAVIATVLVFLLGAITSSVSISQYSLQKTRASFLLEEGAEAIKIARDNNWSNISVLDDETTYYINFSGSNYNINETPLKIGSFDRTLNCQKVYRDLDSDIVSDSSEGIIDANTKFCTIKVSWNKDNITRNEELSLYITNINS